MNKKVSVFLTLLFCWLLQSNYIYAQDNFIEVISNKSIKFSKEGQEKLNRVKNQKLYLEPQLVKFNDIEKVISENKLEFVLPNYSCKLSFTYQNGEYEDKNNYHWYGTLHNEKQKNCYDGSILFMKKDGEVVGTIDIDDVSYEFVEIENGYQILYKINPTEKAICGNENEKDTNPTKNKTKKEEPIDENTMQRIECLELAKVRILVLYTPAGAASVTDITATTNLAAQQMRTALTNSLVSNNDLQIEIAAILPLNFVETSDLEFDVNKLSNDISAQSLRNTHQADLVVLMSNASYIGYAGRVKSIDQGFSNGYAIVVAANASSTKTFAHETGHLLGGRHENDPNGTIQHGHHFRKNFLSPLRGTINATLTGSASDCRVLHYSNPTVSYDGQATGVNGSRNIAQHFRTSGKQVAAYYPNTPGVYYVFLEGNSRPCPGVSNLYEAKINCGKAPFTIQWHTSTNGVNWTFKNGGEYFIFYPPIEMVSSTSIRMTVTDANGATQLHYIHTTSDPNRPPCTSNPLRTADNKPAIIAKVSPNPIEGNAKLYVELPKEDAQTQILIVDSFGKTIQILDTSKFTQKGEFDITGLTTGLYYISVRSQVNGLHSITIQVK